MKWTGTLGPLGVVLGDGRRLAEDATIHLNGPAPLIEDTTGHDRPVIGTVDHVEVRGGVLVASGTVDDPDTAERMDAGELRPQMDLRDVVPDNGPTIFVAELAAVHAGTRPLWEHSRFAIEDWRTEAQQADDLVEQARRRYETRDPGQLRQALALLDQAHALNPAHPDLEDLRELVIARLDGGKRSDLPTLVLLAEIDQRGGGPAYAALCEHYPRKVVEAAIKRDAGRNLVTWGVCLQQPMLTDQGRAVVAAGAPRVRR